MPKRPRVIYAVESGEYDEYRVNRIFTSKRAAERYAKWQDGPACEHPYHFVSEWQLDEPFTVTGHYDVSCAVNLDGKIEGDPAEFIPWTPDGDPKKPADVSPLEDGRGWWINAYGKSPRAALRALMAAAKEVAPK